jgi:hypothetical protein
MGKLLKRKKADGMVNSPIIITTNLEIRDAWNVEYS